MKIVGAYCAEQSDIKGVKKSENFLAPTSLYEEEWNIRKGEFNAKQI